jgi:hypothetical protein
MKPTQFTKREQIQAASESLANIKKSMGRIRTPVPESLQQDLYVIQNALALAYHQLDDYSRGYEAGVLNGSGKGRNSGSF